MFKIDKLKDTGRRPIKFNRFHRHVPLHIRKSAGMGDNCLVDAVGWWRIIFITGGFVQVHQILAAVKSIQKIVRNRYMKGDFVQLMLQKTICGLSKKSAGSRMGRGKGPAVVWGFNVQAGDTLVRINVSVARQIAVTAFKSASMRLPMKLVLI